MIVTEDLQAYSKISRALWLDSAFSNQSSIETLTAVSLLNLTPERTLEKASTILLEKAQRAHLKLGTAADLLLTQFYRLPPEQRLILAALHLGHWSYAVIGRILNTSTSAVEEYAWSARIQLGLSVAYPTGPRQIGPHCPQYESARPWTQKFLDDEIPSQGDRLFLQNHLVSCSSCRETLERSRKTYFSAEKEMIRILGDRVGETHSNSHKGAPDSVLRDLQWVCRQSEIFRDPSKLSLKESLSLFSERSEVRWALFAFGVWSVARMFWGK